MERTIKRGDIYYIASNYREVGSEQVAGRPAVIVSNNNNNNNSSVVEVVYLTTQDKSDLPTHVTTRRAARPSTILCEQICSVSKTRIGDYVGTLTEDETMRLDIALAISLGLDIYSEERVPSEDDSEKLDREPLQERPVLLADAEVVKITVERNLYKKFADDLLEVLKGRGV